MTIKGGDVIAFLGWGGLSAPEVIAADADYPDVADVRASTAYDNGNLTGTLDLPLASNVKEGTTFDGGTAGTLAVAEHVPIDGSGITTRLVTALEDLIADCTSAQTFLGVASSVLAKARIYQDVIESPTAARPWILITVEPGRFERMTAGRRETFNGELTAGIFFEMTAGTETGLAAQQTAFQNKVDIIVDEMMQLSGQVSGGTAYVSISNIDRDSGPERWQPESGDQGGDYFTWHHRVTVGYRGPEGA